jgi:hypothetical protein
MLFTAFGRAEVAPILGISFEAAARANQGVE